MVRFLLAKLTANANILTSHILKRLTLVEMAHYKHLKTPH